MSCCFLVASVIGTEGASGVGAMREYVAPRVGIRARQLVFCLMAWWRASGLGGAIVVNE